MTMRLDARMFAVRARRAIRGAVLQPAAGQALHRHDAASDLQAFRRSTLKFITYPTRFD